MDRVAFVGAVTALVGALVLPFAEYRANRIVAGVLLRSWDSAGWLGWLLVTTVVAALAASALPKRRSAMGVLAAGAAGFSAWVLAVGASAARHMPAGESSARVSIAIGAWVVLVGFAIVWFQGQRSVHATAPRVAAAGVAIASVFGGWFLGGLPKLSLAYEYRAQADTFWTLVTNHVALSIGGCAIAAIIGVPLGIAAVRTRIVRTSVIPAAGIIQTVPSLALYGLLIVPLGMLRLPTLGALPALIALTLYALLPIVRNTYLGMSGVDAAVVDAGTGMGMGRAALLMRIELPLALPLILEGVRVALVMTIGVAAVMAIIGAQTLGVLIYQGFGGIAPDLVLLGAIPMVMLSIVADQGVRALQSSIVSPGIRPNDGQD